MNIFERYGIKPNKTYKLRYAFNIKKKVELVVTTDKCEGKRVEVEIYNEYLNRNTTLLLHPAALMECEIEDLI